MKRRVRKEDVIRTTWQLITRHGIRAVRVDEIAQCLGMSKRTLYELFPDKTNLIAACLEQTSRQQKEKSQRMLLCRSSIRRILKPKLTIRVALYCIRWEISLKPMLMTQRSSGQPLI